LFIHAGMSDGRDVAKGQKDKVQRWMKDAAGDEGSGRVMEDRAKWMEGEK
jgi:hypothetical protein